MGLDPPFKAIQKPPFVGFINYRWLNIHFPKAVIGSKDSNVGLVRTADVYNWAAECRLSIVVGVKKTNIRILYAHD